VVARPLRDPTAAVPSPSCATDPRLPIPVRTPRVTFAQEQRPPPPPGGHENRREGGTGAHTPVPPATTTSHRSSGTGNSSGGGTGGGGSVAAPAAGGYSMGLGLHAFSAFTSFMASLGTPTPTRPPLHARLSAPLSAAPLFLAFLLPPPPSLWLGHGTN